MIHRFPARKVGEGLAFQPDHPFEPPVSRTDKLVHGQRIEKFVGDDQQRRIVGQGRNVVVVMAAGEFLPLQAAQGRRGFDKVNLRSEFVARRSGQRIARQRAAARAEFDIMDIFAAAHPHPQISQPQPDQLAEHLADFGCSDEIALIAERIAAGVIACVAFAHVVRKADRAGFSDQAAQAFADIDIGAGKDFGFEPRLFFGGGFCSGFGFEARRFFSRSLGRSFGFDAGLFLGGGGFGCCLRLQPGLFFRSSFGSGGLCGSLRLKACFFFRFGLGFGRSFSLGAGGGLGFGAGLGFGLCLGLGTCFGFGLLASLCVAAGLFFGGSFRGGFGFAAGARFGLCFRFGGSLGLGLGLSLRFFFGFLARLGLGFGASLCFCLCLRAGLGFRQLLRAGFGGSTFAGVAFGLSLGLGFRLGFLAGFLGCAGAVFGFGPGAGERFSFGERFGFDPGLGFGLGFGAGIGLKPGFLCGALTLFGFRLQARFFLGASPALFFGPSLFVSLALLLGLAAGLLLGSGKRLCFGFGFRLFCDLGAFAGFVVCLGLGVRFGLRASLSGSPDSLLLRLGLGLRSRIRVDQPQRAAQRSGGACQVGWTAALPSGCFRSA